MSKPDSIAALVDLGFTELEADVYSFLLQESPVTGYRVSQATGRLPGNVYKALESLQAKGAIIVDEGASRMCRAIPYTELISILRRRYEEREARAVKVLSELKEPLDDHRVYQLRSCEQVLERARTMILGAEKCVVIDAFPLPLAALKDDLEAASAKGTKVFLKAFLETDIQNVDLVYNPRGEDMIEVLPGQWLILIVDGKQLLLASFDNDGVNVHQAIWSKSVTLSYMFHCSLSAEVMLTHLMNQIVYGKDLEELRSAIETFIRPDRSIVTPPTGTTLDMIRRVGWLYSREVPAFQELWQTFGGTPPEFGEKAVAVKQT